MERQSAFRSVSFKQSHSGIPSSDSSSQADSSARHSSASVASVPTQMPHRVDTRTPDASASVHSEMVLHDKSDTPSSHGPSDLGTAATLAQLFDDTRPSTAATHDSVAQQDDTMDGRDYNAQLVEERDESPDRSERFMTPLPPSYPAKVPPNTAVEVNFAYTAQKEDELDLEVGDIIIVKDCPSDEWWVGLPVGGGKQVARAAFFPSNFIKVKHLPAHAVENSHAASRPQSVEPVAAPFTLSSSSSSATVVNSKHVSSAEPERGRQRSDTTSVMSVDSDDASSIKSSKSERRKTWFQRPFSSMSSGNSSSATKPRARSMSEPSAQEEETPSALPLQDVAPLARVKESSMEASQLLLSNGGGGHQPQQLLRRKSTTHVMGTLSARSDWTESQDSIERALLSVTAASAFRAGNWQDNIPAEIVKTLSTEECKRQEAIWELIATEKDYVRDVNLIHAVFMAPLTEKKAAPDTKIARIFSNLEQIVAVNKLLLRSLLERRREEKVIGGIGDIFLTLYDKFIVYIQYCSNHASAMRQVQNLLENSNKFKNALEECQKSALLPKGQDLNSFLLKPVQRICKYNLLIKEILKYTPPSMPDFADLKEAIEKLNTILKVANEGTRQAEMTQAMNEVQASFNDKLNLLHGTRELIRDDVVMQLIGDEKKERRLLLFTDLVLLGKRTWLDKSRYQLIERFTIDEVTLNADREDLLDLSIGKKARSFQFYFSTKKGLAEWHKALLESKDTIRLGPSRKMTLVTPPVDTASVTTTSLTVTESIPTETVDLLPMDEATVVAPAAATEEEVVEEVPVPVEVPAEEPPKTALSALHATSTNRMVSIGGLNGVRDEASEGVLLSSLKLKQAEEKEAVAQQLRKEHAQHVQKLELEYEAALQRAKLRSEEMEATLQERHVALEVQLKDTMSACAVAEEGRLAALHQVTIEQQKQVASQSSLEQALATIALRDASLTALTDDLTEERAARQRMLTHLQEEQERNVQLQEACTMSKDQALNFASLRQESDALTRENARLLEALQQTELILKSKRLLEKENDELQDATKVAQDLKRRLKTETEQRQDMQVRLKATEAERDTLLRQLSDQVQKANGIHTQVDSQLKFLSAASDSKVHDLERQLTQQSNEMAAMRKKTEGDARDAGKRWAAVFTGIRSLAEAMKLPIDGNLDEFVAPAILARLEKHAEQSETKRKVLQAKVKKLQPVGTSAPASPTLAAHPLAFHHALPRVVVPEKRQEVETVSNKSFQRAAEALVALVEEKAEESEQAAVFKSILDGIAELVALQEEALKTAERQKETLREQVQLHEQHQARTQSIVDEQNETLQRFQQNLNVTKQQSFIDISNAIVAIELLFGLDATSDPSSGGVQDQTTIQYRLHRVNLWLKRLLADNTSMQHTLDQITAATDMYDHAMEPTCAPLLSADGKTAECSHARGWKMMRDRQAIKQLDAAKRVSELEQEVQILSLDLQETKSAEYATRHAFDELQRVAEYESSERIQALEELTREKDTIRQLMMETCSELEHLTSPVRAESPHLAI